MGEARTIFSVTFGEVVSDTLELIGAKKTIGSPKTKTTRISVPGSDVTLDFTEAFGGIYFENRSIQIVFLSLKPWSQQMAQDSTVKNAIHGKKLHISFNDDPDYYWVGRVSVGNWEYYRGAGRVIVTIDAEPYKYHADETTVTGSGEITLTNDRMPVVPYISCSAETTLTWDGYSVTLSAGDDQRVPQLLLQEGDTVVTASASVTFRYREGSL